MEESGDTYKPCKTGVQGTLYFRWLKFPAGGDTPTRPLQNAGNYGSHFKMHMVGNGCQTFPIDVWYYVGFASSRTSATTCEFDRVFMQDTTGPSCTGSGEASVGY
jgi:hypothetical protein